MDSKTEATYKPILQEIRKKWYASTAEKPLMLHDKVSTSKLVKKHTMDSFGIWYVYNKCVKKKPKKKKQSLAGI